MFFHRIVPFLGVVAFAWFASGAAENRTHTLARAPRAAEQDGKLPHKDTFARLGTTLFRAGDGILCLAYSPDGKMLASGGRNDSVRVWDAQTGQLLREFHEHWVWAVAFMADGKYLATGGANKVIRLWNLETGKEVRQMTGHQATVKSLAFSSDGAALVSGGDDNTVRLWKVVDGSEMATYQKHTFGVNAVAISPDNKHFASASTDRTVRVWEYGEKAVVLQTPAAATAVAYMPDRKTLVTAGDDGFVRLWDIASAKEIRQWKAHDNTITHLGLSQNGAVVATASWDKTVRLWDVAKGTQIHKLERHSGDGDALALSRDGKQVAAAGLNNSVRRWNATTGKPVEIGKPSATGHWPLGAITSVALSHDGNRAAVAFSTNQIIHLDHAFGKEGDRQQWDGADGDVLLAFSPDGKTLAIAAATNMVWLQDVSGEKANKVELPMDKGDEVRALAFSADSRTLAVASANGGVRIWNAKTYKVHKNMPMPHGARAVAFSRDGKFLAVGAEDAIVILDTDAYKPVREFAKLNDTVSCLAFSPDGRTLAAGMFGGPIRLFDMIFTKGKVWVEPRSLEGHRGLVNALAWSVNGRCLVSAGYDKTVRVWEYVNAQPITVWPGHAGEVTAVAFHPNGRMVVSGSRDTTLLLWDATGLGLAGKLPEPKASEVAALDLLWKDLASDNNVKGNAAMWTMASTKDVGNYLSKKVFLTDPKKIKQYIEDLNSNNFKVREKAFAALASYERWIERVLEDTKKNPSSEEVRQRVELLLKRLKGKDAISLEQEHLRARRVIEILEQANTAAAHELLKGMANGAPDDDLRAMAQAAFERVAKK
ncbi:MAG TPA: WD40 repeat domain-containing protein [Gemmataceae bacterium]|nr:WD40 repeat domain-containing protein [Gemmataceae bacterium]